MSRGMWYRSPLLISELALSQIPRYSMTMSAFWDRPYTQPPLPKIIERILKAISTDIKTDKVCF